MRVRAIKALRRKLVRVSPTWLWAHKYDERKKKHWNWRLIDAMQKVEHKSCVPFALYKWKAFGFDGKEQPMWTVADYMTEWYEYADQRL